jgi:hypothetical protein
MDISKLKEEINSDPLGRGYSGMDDAAVAASLNTADRSRIVGETVGVVCWCKCRGSPSADQDRRG